MKKYLQKNKRYVAVGCIALFLVVVLIAVFINYLTIINLGFEVSENSVWLSFYATIIAAILGGIISGGLTLLGVIHTINSQDKKERRNQLPKKLMEAQIIYEKIDAMIDFYDYYNQLDDFNTYLPKRSLHSIKERVKLDLENKQEYLKSASTVNFELYDDVYSIYEKISSISEIVNAENMIVVPHDYDIDSEFISDYKGYIREVYENIKMEIESMIILKTFINEIIVNLGNEYNELSK